VLLDLKMPRKGGLEVLKWVRAHKCLHSLIVVIFTSSTARDDVVNAYQAGANSYLVKPSSLGVLTEVARDLATYWLRRNEPPIPAY
jgi:DNA-binding response OmpR family regulator